MNTKFTPGPWEVRKHKFEGLCVHAPTIEAISGCNYIVASDVNGDETVAPTYGTPEANARLIAAAPELLDALRKYLAAGFGNSTDHHKQAEAYDTAIAAIAKATGEQV